MADPLSGPDPLPTAGPLPLGDPLATPAASTFRSGGSPPALRVEGLRKTYEDGFTAVAGLDLEIPDGAFFGLLGPNGAGKTTLSGSVCNIVRPSAGSLSVFGHDYRSRQARRLLGLAAQEITNRHASSATPSPSTPTAVNCAATSRGRSTCGASAPGCGGSAPASSTAPRRWSS